MPIFRKRDSGHNRRIFVVMTDFHSGKRIGLLNPATVLVKQNDDGSILEWQPEQTITQAWLWSVYMDGLGQLKEWAGVDEIIICHNGDITNGDRFDSNIPETTREDQRIIACDNLRPYVELPNVKKIRLMTGTAVHVPECAEARIAYRLREETGKDIESRHHARFSMGQDVIEVAHHGPYPGSRDWLMGNVAFLHLKDRVARDRRGNKPPARIYLYGHYHALVHACLKDRWHGQYCESDLVVIPSLCGLDDFARKVTKSAPVLEAGIVALEFIDGKLTDMRDFVQEIDLRTEEEL